MALFKNKYELGRIEVAFIIIILAGILAAGFYAWKTDRNKKTDINSFADCVAAGYPVMESYPEQCAAKGKTFVNPDQQEPIPEEVALLPVDDWVTYTGAGLSLKHPADWSPDESLEGTSASVNIVSADFIKAEDLGPSVKAGYRLEVFNFTDDQKSYNSYDEHLADLQGTEQGCGGSFSASEVDGLPAIISDIKCHGTYRYVHFYKNDIEYMIRLNGLDEETTEFKQLFTTILSTVQVN